MCGLFGAFGNKSGTGNFTELLQQAAVVNALRGAQSTGVAKLNIGGKLPTIKKKAVSGQDFIKDQECRNFVEYTDRTVLMLGHNRAATLGSVKDANAHPFQRGNITLTHNGHLSNAHSLGSKAGLRWNEWDVDSDTACALLDKLPAEEALSYMDGAFALVWHDAVDNSINFASNGERPLVFAETDGGTMLYASERGMLEWLAYRNRVEIKRWYALNKNQFVKFQFTEGGAYRKAQLKTFEKRNLVIPSDSGRTRWYGEDYYNYLVEGRGAGTGIDHRSESVKLKAICKEKGEVEEDKETWFIVYDDEENENYVTLKCHHIVAEEIKCDVRLTKALFSDAIPAIKEMLRKDQLHYISGRVTSIGYTGAVADADTVWKERRAFASVYVNTMLMYNERLEKIAEFKDLWKSEGAAITTAQDSSTPVHVSRRELLGRKARNTPPPIGTVMRITDPVLKIGHILCPLKKDDLVMYQHVDSSDKNLWVVQDSSRPATTYRLSPRRMERATAAESDKFMQEMRKLRLVH